MDITLVSQVTKRSILERFSTVKTEVKEQTEFLANISHGLCKYCEKCRSVTAPAKHQACPLREPFGTVLLRGVEKCQIADLLERSKLVYFILKQQGSCLICLLYRNTCPWAQHPHLHPKPDSASSKPSWARHVHKTHRGLPEPDGTTSSSKGSFPRLREPASQTSACIKIPWGAC